MHRMGRFPSFLPSARLLLSFADSLFSSPHHHFRLVPISCWTLKTRPYSHAYSSRVDFDSLQTSSRPRHLPKMVDVSVWSQPFRSSRDLSLSPRYTSTAYYKAPRLTSTGQESSHCRSRRRFTKSNSHNGHLAVERSSLGALCSQARAMLTCQWTSHEHIIGAAVAAGIVLARVDLTSTEHKVNGKTKG